MFTLTHCIVWPQFTSCMHRYAGWSNQKFPGFNVELLFRFRWCICYFSFRAKQLESKHRCWRNYLRPVVARNPVNIHETFTAGRNDKAARPTEDNSCWNPDCWTEPRANIQQTVARSFHDCCNFFQLNCERCWNRTWQVFGQPCFVFWHEAFGFFVASWKW